MYLSETSHGQRCHNFGFHFSHDMLSSSVPTKKEYDMTMHEGGCACGEVRYSTTSEVRRAVVCHCRYCQTRTGSAFGISVYFDQADVKIHSGELSTYSYKTESGSLGTTRFCKNCGTTLFWNITHDMFKDWTGVAGGSFDPPTFWYDMQVEVFCRSSAPWLNTTINEKHDTSRIYKPVNSEADHLSLD